MFLYCVVGALIRKGQGKTGKDVIPHAQFLSDLPGLIAVCLLAYKQTAQSKDDRGWMTSLDRKKLGSLSMDDARKQCSDWLNEKNNHAARAARTLI